MTFRQDSPKIDPKYLLNMSDNESSVGTPDPNGCMMFYSSEDFSDNDTISVRPGVTTRSQARRRARSAPTSRPSSRSAKSRSSSRTQLSRPNSRNGQHADPHFRPVTPDRHLARSLPILDDRLNTIPKVKPLPRRSRDMTKDITNTTPRKLKFDAPREPEDTTLTPTDQPDPPSDDDRIHTRDLNEHALSQLRTKLADLEEKHKATTALSREFEKQAGQTKLDNNRYKHAYKNLQLQFTEESQRFEVEYLRLQDKSEAYEEHIEELSERTNKGRQDRHKMDEKMADLKAALTVKNAHIDEAAILTTAQIDKVEDLNQQLKSYESKEREWNTQRRELQ